MSLLSKPRTYDYIYTNNNRANYNNFKLTFLRSRFAFLPVIKIPNYGVFWGPRGCYIFLNDILNYLKGNCVLRTLARSPLQKIASLFFERDGHTHIHTYIHTYTQG